MRHILSSRSRPVLRKFASANVLVALDFDGTLAPIISEADRADMRPVTRKLLGDLTALFPCIVVSGRSRDDVRRKLGRIQLVEIIGNHGIEPWNSSRAIARAVEAWRPFLKRKLGHFRGVFLENKQFSLSIHYRRARNKKRALRAIMEAVESLPGAKLVGGKQVVNVVPHGAPNKGAAVERARRKIHCDKVIYAGDDETDEDVFALGPAGRFLTVRVARKMSSLARFYLRNQREIDRLLRTLVELRLSALAGRGAGRRA